MIEQLDKDVDIADVISAVNEIIEHLNSVPPLIYQVNIENMSKESAGHLLNSFEKNIRRCSPSLKFIINATRGDVGTVTSSDLFTARVKNLTVEDCEKIIEKFQDRKRRLENGEEL